MRHRIARIGIAGLAALLVSAVAADAQEPAVITGRVQNEAGAPINAATIFSSTANVGTQTREDGTYRLVLPGTTGANASIRLSARRLGFRESTVTVTLRGATTEQNFTLQASAVQLTGVVVSALSLQREKATIGTSQQQLSSEDVTRTRDPNIVNSLSGKVSGVQITGGGNIGGSSRIVIRGASSINGNNQPLFIVDGVPVANNDNNSLSAATANGGYDFGNAVRDLNPDDIESITVLKGPNAAALYGSRAANGAIVITTRSGRGTEGTRFTLNSYYTMDSFSRLPKYQNLYGQGAGGEFQFVDGAGGGVNDGNDQSFGPRLDGRLIDQFTGKAQPWVPAPNNVRDYFQTGATMSNNLSLVASSGPANARLSVTNEQVKGIIPNSATRKLTAALNGGIQLNPRLSTTASIQYIQNTATNRPGTGYNVSPLEQFIWFGRQVNTDTLRKVQYDAQGNLFNWNYNYHNNPYWLQQFNPERDQRDRVIAQATVQYQLTPWLRVLGRSGTDSYRENFDLRWAQGNLVFADPSYAGAFNFTNNRQTATNSEAIVTAQGTFGRVALTGNLGGAIIRNTFASNNTASAGLTVPGIYNVSNAAITPTVTNFEQRFGENAVYGSAIMTFNDLWTVEATARNDWSSTLPKENSSYFYPSVNSSLIVSDLFPSIARGPLSYLKVRGGYAQVGAPAQPYQLQSTYNGLPAKFGSSPLFTYSNTIANQNLKPERTMGAEGGVEFGLWGDRVTFDGTYYNKITKDQILNLTIAPATGFAAKAINAGQISNRGVEASLSVRPVRRPNFEWTSTVNFSRNRNKVDALAPGLSTVILGTNWSVNVEAREGEAQGALFGAPFLRDSATGQLITSDGLPQADAANRRVLGNYNPEWTGGWFNEFRRRNVALSFLLDVRRGGQIFSSGNMFATYTGVLQSTIAGREVDFDDPGIVVRGIDAETGEQNDTRVTAEEYYQSLYGIHEAFVSDAGFIKLREVRLTWDLPANLARGLRISSGNVALVGRNLWMKTKFPNFDPEVAYSSGNAQGFDFASTPTTRTFGINLTITP